MSISKKSIIGGLGLALSLASGLAQAGQECNAYNPGTTQYAAGCELHIRGIPANKTIVFNVLTRVDVYDRTIFGRIFPNGPYVHASVFRGNLQSFDHTRVATWNDALTRLSPGVYRLSKNYSFNTGAGAVAGQTGYNYRIYTQINGDEGAISTLKSKTNHNK